MPQTISAIAACAENNVIGKNNELPWRLPADFKYFKQTTMGHPVIMGRKTFESLGNKALPGRKNIIISRRNDFKINGASVTNSIGEALEMAKTENDNEIFILGGAEIYRQAMPLLDKIYLTRIYEKFDGDAFFPEIDPEIWQLVKEDLHEPDEQNRYKYAFQLWERKLP